MILFNKKTLLIFSIILFPQLCMSETPSTSPSCMAEFKKINEDISLKNDADKGVTFFKRRADVAECTKQGLSKKCTGQFQSLAFSAMEQSCKNEYFEVNSSCVNYFDNSTDEIIAKLSPNCQKEYKFSLVRMQRALRSCSQFAENLCPKSLPIKEQMDCSNKFIDEIKAICTADLDK
jgi:hypothetical protein